VSGLNEFEILEGIEMLKNRFAGAIAASALLVCSASSMLLAQELITQKALSLDAAQAIARGAVETCRANGYRVTVTVIDANGTMKAFLRDDGTAPHTIDFSLRKAYTALTFRRTSAETGKAWAANPPAPNIAGTVGTAGGVPIRLGMEVIGAIGVSGSPGGDKDEVCANAGIAKIADQLKAFVSPTP
jgi:uncharacterized protein GlcG (DUF336 family)